MLTFSNGNVGGHVEKLKAICLLQKQAEWSGSWSRQQTLRKAEKFEQPLPGETTRFPK